MRLNQAWLAGGAVLLAAGLLAQAPKTGVIFQCDEGNQARVTQCVNGRCDVELGPAGRLTPYMTLPVAGTNRFLRSQGCVDGGGKAAGAVVAPSEAGGERGGRQRAESGVHGGWSFGGASARGGQQHAGGNGWGLPVHLRGEEQEDG